MRNLSLEAAVRTIWLFDAEKMKNTFFALFILSFSVCLFSCTAKDERYYVRRGEEVQRQLIIELEGAHALHDLFARQDSLTLLFDELSKVAVEARAFQVRSKKTWEVPSDSHQLSQRLAQEIQRVLQIPGARAFLEKCQAKGFERIDAFEKAKERSLVTVPSGSAESHTPKS